MPVDLTWLVGGGGLAALAGFTLWLLKDYIATLKKAISDEQARNLVAAADLRASTAAFNHVGDTLEERNRLDAALLARRR